MRKITIPHQNKKTLCPAHKTTAQAASSASNDCRVRQEPSIQPYKPTKILSTKPETHVIQPKAEPSLSEERDMVEYKKSKTLTKKQAEKNRTNKINWHLKAQPESKSQTTSTPYPVPAPTHAEEKDLKREKVKKPSSQNITRTRAPHVTNKGLLFWLFTPTHFYE
jgi:hypothetical protein